MKRRQFLSTTAFAALAPAVLASSRASAQQALRGGTLRVAVLADILKVAVGASLLPQLQRLVTNILHP